nr:hypothetical protein GCM10025732_46200 [Glycomyces mayteni]
MTDLLIKSADIVEKGRQDVLVRDGRVAEIGSLTAKDAQTVDADGLVLLPGLVDLHTHLREPGREDAETVYSGTRAAAKGGYTAVCAMANSYPVADTAGVVEQVAALGKAAGYADVQPIGAVSIGLEGKQLAEIGAMAHSAAAVRMFSDDGHCVSDPILMRRALEYVKTFGGLIAQHAEEPRLTEGAQMNEGAVSAELGLPGWPAVAEEAIIARDVLLAEYTGARVHFCHVSTARSVDIIREAKARGAKVTAEVCPHHLLLTDEAARTYDPVYKVNPPLRRESDVAVLRGALAEGVIDAVATDHAPHPRRTRTASGRPPAPGCSAWRPPCRSPSSPSAGPPAPTGTPSPSAPPAPPRASPGSKPTAATRSRAPKRTSRSSTPPRPGPWSPPTSRPSRATPPTPGWNSRSPSRRRSSEDAPPYSTARSKRRRPNEQQGTSDPRA